MIAPLVASIAVCSYETNTDAGAPQCLRQLSQWHHKIHLGFPVAQNRTAPHKQPPSNLSVIATPSRLNGRTLFAERTKNERKSDRERQMPKVRAKIAGHLTNCSSHWAILER